MQPFIFNFYDEDAEINHDYFFCVDTPDLDSLMEFTQSDIFYDFISDNEDYGVHDVSCGDPFFLGYTSYEVAKSEQEECFYNIINFFRKNGYKVTHIEDIKYSANLTFNSDEWYLNKINFKG